ncbi:MAG: Chromosome partition protein Smc [Calditrichaeota bacterium]|nr:Chromosome partition protein Smc [Calditrichota bacterium]
MHLSGLEIHGFKSFPDKTKLTFSPGVMAIVGPNGCGKTNIVDAVRWVLGEQRASVLRSEKMEHVIFSGSLREKPAARADVTIILENDNGVLPAEYGELAITRRLTRDGDSEYLINRRPSRLKDIRNLFADTGLGPESYSIIELKMVETILSARTEERRRLFEEAAGVTGYKARLRVTRQRLADTRSDLVRLADLLGEVTTRRNSLRRQVNKARRFRHLNEALRVLDIGAAARELGELRAKIAPLDEAVERDRERRETLARDLAKEEAALHKLRGRLGALEEAVETLATEKQQADERLVAARREIDVLEERIRSTGRRGEERDREEQELTGKIAEVEDHLRELAESEERAGDRDSEIRERLEGMRESWDDLQARLHSHTQRRDNAEREKVKAERAQAQLDSSLARANERLASIEAELADGDRRDRLPPAPDSPDGARDAVATLRAAVEQADETAREARAAEESARDEHNEVERNAVGLGRDLNSARERVEFLERIVRSGRGRSEAVQSVLTAGIEAVHGRLGDAVVVSDDAARTAVAAALEHLTDAIVLETEGVEQAVKLLEGDDTGRATLLPFTRRAPESQPPFANETGVLARLSEMISAKGQAGEAARAFLARYRLVEDLPALLAHAPAAIEAHCGIVTRDGCVLHPDGSLSAGRAKVDDLGAGGLLEDAVRLRDDLARAHEAVEKERAATADSLKQAVQARERAEERRNELARQLRRADEKLLIVEQEWRDYLAVKRRREEERERLAGERDQLKAEIERNERELADAAKALKRADEQYGEIREQGADLRRESEAMRSARDQVREKQVEVSSALERVRGEIGRRRALKQEYEHRLAQLRGERDRAGEALEDASARLRHVRGELAVHEKEAAAQGEALANKRAGYEKLQRERGEREGELGQWREELTRLADRVHTKEMERKDLVHRMSSVRERILDSYEIDVLETSQEELPLAVEDDNPYIGRPLGELREIVREFGPVNQMALEEFEVVDRRWKQLSEQHEDLERAVETLEDTIREINGIARKRFLETFSRVEGHFVGLFSRLFGGGEAALSLAEGDPLEAGIHIYASPRGKKLSSIDLLSGGEKAMTAIALLFALYLERPSPFCFLDEVDAPLDDVNVIRFNRLLREFTDRTQFLVVTHNKLTMERADRLYGVTMEEEGISKLVAVEIGSAEREGVEA